MTEISNLRERREATVKEHIEAENTGNLDVMIAGFHHPRYDVVPMGVVSDGEKAVRGLIGGLVAAFPDFHFEIVTLRHADDAVIVEGRITGTHRGEWAGLQPQGRKMDIRAACFFNFDEDRLLNETVYFDLATLQRQLAG